jgi:hypothetical protein
MVSVVTLRAFNEQGSETGLGSGFLLKDGRVATNSHVVADASWIEVLSTDDEYLGTASFAEALSTRLDLAILPAIELPNISAKGLSLSDSDPVIGDEVWVIGSPEGLTGTMSNGIVSALRDLDGQRFLQITAPISRGSSGGPVLNDSGEVVGVAVGLIPEGQNLNFAVPASYLASLARSPAGRFPFPISETLPDRRLADDIDSDATATMYLLAMLAVAGDIQLNETRRGRIEADDFELDGDLFDLYKFYGDEGQRLTIEMESVEMDPIVGILSPNLSGEEGEWGEFDDDGGAGTNARLEVTLPAGGLYLIVAMSYENGTGEYALAVSSATQQRGAESSEALGDRWRYITTSQDDDEWWWDSQSVERRGSTVSGWIRIDYPEIQRDDGRVYDRAKILVDIECDHRRWRFRSSTFSLDGRHVESRTWESWEMEWQVAVPETVGESILDVACE